MTGDYQTEARMRAKLAAVPLPDIDGRTLLDVGTDHGFWAFLAAQRGAARILGLDRNREVRGQGHVDLVARNRAEAVRCELADRVQFAEIDIGRQWHLFGRFDVVLAMSVFHHIYEACGDLHAAWFWLWQHVAPDGVLIWEGPVDDRDSVVRANVGDANRQGYTRERLLSTAGVLFDVEIIGPALHEPTREVWRMTRKRWNRTYAGAVCAGAGGAAKAFCHAEERRIREIDRILGFRPYPGSLNLHLIEAFSLDRHYVRAQLLDVADRSAGLGSLWVPRWARFYPVTVEGHEAYAFRFEGERYKETFVEIIAPQRLRDRLHSDAVTLVS